MHTPPIPGFDASAIKQRLAEEAQAAEAAEQAAEQKRMRDEEDKERRRD